MSFDRILENQANTNAHQNRLKQNTAPTLSDRCLELANSPSILSLFSKSLKDSGFAGSTHVPELLFLTLYTGVDKPVSAAIKGPSGSGKSYALQTALKYIPPSAYELFHGMSEKALLYLDVDLKNKFLIIQEAAGISEGLGRVFLRQLQSEGQVRYVTVVSTAADGLVGRELPRIEGPTGVIFTTTANGLHPEDETRLISIRMDESPERIREALRAQATSATNAATEDQLAPWHELHDFVCASGSSVLIPYAHELAERIPVSHHRVARDFPHVLSLIRAHARLHQCNRDRDERGRIVATVYDYIVTHRLVAGALAEGLEVTVPPHIREVVEAVAELSGAKTSSNSNTGFVRPVSQHQLAKYLGRDPSVISRNARAAIQAGYLINQSRGQGREASLVLGEQPMPTGRALPLPQELGTVRGSPGETTPVSAAGKIMPKIPF
jgi:hypothetical protein